MPLSRADLETLGMTDKELAKLAKKHFDVVLAFADKPDTPEAAELRALWFRQVTVAEEGSTAPLNHDLPPARSFAQDNPKAHGALRNPGAPSDEEA